MSLSPTVYVMRLILPSVDGLKGLDQMDVKGFLKDFNREAPLPMRLTVLLGSWAFILSPIVTLKIPLPVFLLSKKLQDEHCYRIALTRVYLLRQLMFAVKAVAGFCWGKCPEVRAQLDLKPYDPDTGGFRQ